MYSRFRKLTFLSLAILGLGGLIAQENQSNARTLKLKLSYTGAGTVDEKHKLYVFLFDSPEFIKGEQVPPIGAQTASAKSETLAFTVTTSPVYVVAAYDVAGTYDGQSGPPPSGSPVAVYSAEPGVPTPIKIEAGKTAEVDLTFDDTIKMP